jgi:peptidoglycan/LPS O-acetylase OafA/YrhL
MPALTGIRGWAAIWVLLYHITLFDYPPGFENGYLGVDAFFILSGFVLSHGYARRLAPLSFGGWLRFITGRIARIYPLHLLTLGLTLLVVLALPDFRAARSAGRFSTDAFFAGLALIQNWGVAMPLSWNLPSWSLSAEWAAYLVFPLMTTVVVRIRSRGWALLGAACLLLLLFAAFRLVLRLPSLDSHGTSGMIRMAFEFSAGCLLWRAAALGWRLTPSLEIVPPVLLVLAAFVPGASFLALPAFAGFVLLAAGERGRVYRALAHPASVFLGEISFSVYLIHYVPLDLMHWAVEPAVPRWVWHCCQAAFVPATLVVSFVVYEYFEMPAKRWFTPRRSVPQPAE